MTFEGQQMQGAAKIMEKVSSLTFQKIQRSITACDAQPTFDGGVLISVLGQLKVILFDLFRVFCAERLLRLD